MRMVEHNYVPPALWKGENFPTLTLVPSCQENPDSLRKELILCFKTLHSTINSITQACNCAFSVLKNKRGGTNKAMGTFNIFTLFHLVYL